ncbi:unnamed protein product [Strongylus vulgaris]|uniref:Uncharacterized protein n=1 Tax=Strongylus vulgaris TaxID=40348 RepID=A0A3P7J673_STRVU|nr:unnamed protein product [Strongylus vulgaris]
MCVHDVPLSCSCLRLAPDNNFFLIVATAVLEGYKDCRYPPGVGLKKEWRDTVQERIGQDVLIMATAVLGGYKDCHYPKGIEFNKEWKAIVQDRVGENVVCTTEVTSTQVLCVFTFLKASFSV